MDDGDDADARKRRGHQAGDFRPDPDDRHGQRGQRQHEIEGCSRQPFARRHTVTAAFASGAGHLKLSQLRQKNHNREAVDEPEHNRMRHEADEFTPMHKADKQLDNSHQHDCRKQVLNTVIGNQGHHDNGQSPSRAGNHARTSANQRSDKADDKRRVQTDQRFNPCHKGKSHRFGDQCQCHCQSRQDLDPQTFGCEIAPRRFQIGVFKSIYKVCEYGLAHGFT